MKERSITHFNVGNGNSSVLKVDELVIVIDLNCGVNDESSYDLLKPNFSKRGGIDCIDVLCITHGDEDHCKDFTIFKEKIENGELIIGSIWHQGYDRRKKSKIEELPEDYIAFQKEVDRRNSLSSPSFGDIQIALKAKDDQSKALEGNMIPDNFYIKVLGPFIEDDEDSEYNHNDLSLILNISIDDLSILYTGDASSKYWQDRVVPDLLELKEFNDWAKADILEVGHHGSYDFFGPDRESVRDSDENPDNYSSLSRIEPGALIISSISRFPTNGDSSGDDPPHYAAWKWYHKWFMNNRDVSEQDKHPTQFKYTCDGNIRIWNNEGTWEWEEDWNPNNKDVKGDQEKEAKKIKQKLVSGSLLIGSSLSAKQNKGFYGWLKK